LKQTQIDGKRVESGASELGDPTERVSREEVSTLEKCWRRGSSGSIERR